MKKVLVTGGAGFIGSHLVELLLARGHEVWTIDDLSTGKLSALDNALNHPKHHFMEGSILDKRLLEEVLPQVDVIYHLAAVLGVKNCVENPLTVIKGNIDGTKNVLEVAAPLGKKVIFASTSEVYGKNKKLPFREHDDRVYGSAHIHRWCYATAKALDEHLCLAYAKAGLPVTILRYFNAYGPRATSSAYGGVIPRFIAAALKGEPIEVHGTGQQTRCFTYISDTVEASYRAMDPKANGLIINVGNNKQVSIETLAYMIKGLTHSSSEIVYVPYEKAYGEGFEDMAKRQPDITRLKEVLDFKPRIHIKAGLYKTIQWFKAEASRLNMDHSL